MGRRETIQFKASDWNHVLRDSLLADTKRYDIPEHELITNMPGLKDYKKVHAGIYVSESGKIIFVVIPQTGSLGDFERVRALEEWAKEAFVLPHQSVKVLTIQNVAIWSTNQSSTSEKFAPLHYLGYELILENTFG